MGHSIGIELVLPESTYQALKRAAEQNRKTEAEFALDAIRAYLKPSAQANSLLGLFADDPELIDGITESAMALRERTPLRVTRRQQPRNI
ncbi:MAG: hypothetical protein FJ009_12995 [Chloroflexi bacterium]|nr:hypothetical protein [Chloroflexota bacterium]